MSKNDTKYCSNCCQKIEASKFFLHERMCSINVKKCPKCNKPFTVQDLEEHIEEAHGETECEYCKKKYQNSEIEKHRKRCDHKLVPCSFCEMQVLLLELREHQEQCGAITEPCPQCGRYIRRKDLDNHILDGCPPPKNDRRSVDVAHNSNSKLSLDMNKNNSIYNNYNPVNDFIPEDILFGDDKKIDIKMHNNYNKPKLNIRPASGKKILNENAKKKMSNIGNNQNNKENKIFMNDNSDNKVNKDNKDNKDNKININMNNKTTKNTTKNKNNNIRTGKTSGTIKNNGKNDKTKYDNYINKQNISKEAVPLKQINNNININNDNKNNLNNTRYNNRKNSNKPSFATNLSKGNLNTNSKKMQDKISDEEFRKSREKFHFQNAKNLEKGHLNKELNNININNKKGIINDEDYLANFNFGDVDDEQLIQQAIEQSIIDQAKKNKK